MTVLSPTPALSGVFLHPQMWVITRLRSVGAFSFPARKLSSTARRSPRHLFPVRNRQPQGPLRPPVPIPSPSRIPIRQQRVKQPHFCGSMDSAGFRLRQHVDRTRCQPQWLRSLSNRQSLEQRYLSRERRPQLRRDHQLHWQLRWLASRFWCRRVRQLNHGNPLHRRRFLPGVPPFAFSAYGSESDAGPMPIPLTNPLRATPSRHGDRHVIVLDTPPASFMSFTVPIPKPRIGTPLLPQFGTSLQMSSARSHGRALMPQVFLSSRV